MKRRPSAIGKITLTFLLGGVLKASVAASPGHIQPHSQTSAVVSGVDILPTRLEIAAGDSNRKFPLTLEFHAHIDKTSGDTSHWFSWIRRAETEPRAAELLRKYLHRPAEELYDLENDAEKLKNPAESPANAADLAGMRRTMHVWMQNLGGRGISIDLAARPQQPPSNPDP